MIEIFSCVKSDQIEYIYLHEKSVCLLGTFIVGLGYPLNLIYFLPNFLESQDF
jgi:hypothetical protein